VRLSDGMTVAHEALARCSRPEYASPIALFQQAETENACGRVGRWVRDAVFRADPATALFVNLHPQELHQRWLVQPTDPIYLHPAQVFLEVTESAALKELDVCLSVLNEVRSRCGAHIVVDDFGAGHSDMDRVLLLRPSVVKLDLSLIRDIERSESQQAQVRNIIERCHALDARVVAEGIETTEELVTVKALGADLAQGYLLGRPAPTPERAWWPW
jgi:EAL domain-containing protein (putative c-di-GMP-specific phosphodiesterase class I)